MSRRDVRHPVAHRLVYRVLERAAAAADGPDFGAEQPHAEDVRGLPLDVHLAHVDDTLQAKVSADRRRGDAVLAGARLGDDSLLAEPLREQSLTDGVVDLVRSCMSKVFALEVDLRAAQLTREVGGVVDRCRTAGEVAEHVRHFGGECRVGLRLPVGVLQLLDGGHQRLRDIAPTEIAEAAVLVRKVVHLSVSYSPTHRTRFDLSATRRINLRSSVQRSQASRSASAR
jgi:hypothetical protein